MSTPQGRKIDPSMNDLEVTSPPTTVFQYATNVDVSVMKSGRNGLVCVFCEILEINDGQPSPKLPWDPGVTSSNLVRLEDNGSGEFSGNVAIPNPSPNVSRYLRFWVIFDEAGHETCIAALGIRHQFTMSGDIYPDRLGAVIKRDSMFSTAPRVFKVSLQEHDGDESSEPQFGFRHGQAKLEYSMELSTPWNPIWRSVINDNESWTLNVFYLNDEVGARLICQRTRGDEVSEPFQWGTNNWCWVPGINQVLVLKQA